LLAAFNHTKREHFAYLAAAWLFILFHRLGAAYGASLAILAAKAVNIDPDFRWAILASFCNTTMLAAALFSFVMGWRLKREVLIPIVVGALLAIFFTMIAAEHLPSYINAANKWTSVIAIVALATAVVLATWKEKPVAAIATALSGLVWAAPQTGYPDLGDSDPFMVFLSVSGASFGLALCASCWTPAPVEQPILDPSPDLPDHIAIDRVRLPARIGNAIAGAGFITVGEIRQASENSLLGVPGLGQGSIQYLRNVLGKPTVRPNQTDK